MATYPTVECNGKIVPALFERLSENGEGFYYFSECGISLDNHKGKIDYEKDY